MAYIFYIYKLLHGHQRALRVNETNMGTNRDVLVPAASASPSEGHLDKTVPLEPGCAESPEAMDEHQGKFNHVTARPQQATSSVCDITTSDSKRSDGASPGAPAIPAAGTLSYSQMTQRKVITQEHSQSSSGSGTQQELRKRGSLPPRQVVKGVGQYHKLQTIEPSRRIHACFFKPDTTPELIKCHMKELSQETSFKVEKLKLRHDSYASFIVTVPVSLYELFMSAEAWPVGTRVSEWFQRAAGSANRVRRHPAPGRRSNQKGDEATLAQSQ
jgi:hypothetical protein